MRAISKIILFEYGNNPKEIGLIPFPKLPKSSIITNEGIIFKRNLKLFTAASKSFKAAIGGYGVLKKQMIRNTNDLDVNLNNGNTILQSVRNPIDF